MAARQLKPPQVRDCALRSDPAAGAKAARLLRRNQQVPFCGARGPSASPSLRRGGPGAAQPAGAKASRPRGLRARDGAAAMPTPALGPPAPD